MSAESNGASYQFVVLNLKKKLWMIVKFAELKFTLYTEYPNENVLNIFVRHTYVNSKVIQRESDSIYHGEPWINITIIATNIFKNHSHMTQINIFMTQKIND